MAMGKTSWIFGLLLTATICWAQHDVRSKNSSQSVKDLVNGYKDFMDELMKKGMEVMLPIVQEADLSIECIGSLLKLVSGVRNLEDWAVSMFDATAKIPVGVLGGTNAQFGDYDECLDVINKNNASGEGIKVIFKGQYCTVELHPPEIFYQIPPEHRRELYQDSIIPELKASGGVFEHMLRAHYAIKLMSLRMGLCLPSTCTKDDITALISTVISDLQVKVSIPNCEVKEDEQALNPAQILILSVLGVLLGLTVICSITHSCFPNILNIKHSSSNSGWKIGQLTLDAFTLKSNWSRLSDTNSTHNGALTFLSGMRVIIMITIVSGYSFALPYLPFLHRLGGKINHVRMREEVIYGLFGNNAFPIDSLVFISGLLASYQYGLRSPKSSDWAKSALFLSSIVCKCLGGMCLAIGFFVLLPLLGSGPDWNELVVKNVQVCHDYWWRNLLFIQNFWPFPDNCMYQTYLLSVLVQCSVLTVFLLWILFRKAKLGVTLQLCIIFISAAVAGTQNAVERYPPALALPVLNAHTMFEMMSNSLIKPYNHLSIYSMGILIGWVLHQDLSWSKGTQWVAWFAWFSSTVFVYYIPFNFPYSGETYQILSALYAASFRIVIGVLGSSLILLCAKGGAEGLKRFLSWKTFVCLDKLSYLVYILHPILLLYHFGRARVHFYLGYPDITINALGFITLTFAVSAIFYLFIWSPIERLGSMIRHSHWKVGPESPQQQYMTSVDLPRPPTSKQIKVLS